MRPLRGAWAALILLTANAAVSALSQSYHVLNSPTNSSLTAVVNNSSQWVAVGSNTTLLVSQDGYRWRQVTNNFTAVGDFLCATYGNGLYVVGGTSNNLLCTSADGTNWSVQARSSGAQTVDGLTFGIGLFVAVGSSNGFGFVTVSTNGTDWLTASAPVTPPLKAVTYGTVNGRDLFVAVGEAGALITSTNGLNWTKRDCGTTHSLLAVGSSYRGYVAGGEDNVFSADGLSWSMAAPTSFIVRALAAGYDPVAPGYAGIVAAGNYESEGRLQVSPDGRTWPGLAAVFPRAINGLWSGEHVSSPMAVGDGGLILSANANPGPDANSWTNLVDGYWEQAYWSLGELPAFWDQQVLLTNSGTKTLRISTNTTIAAPYSLQIRALEISAPVGYQNTLLVDHAGLATPLNVQGTICVDTNGALANFGSAVQAGGLVVSNTAVFSDGAQSQFGSVYVYGPSTARLVMSNGFFSASQTLMVGSGDSGTAGIPGGGPYRGMFTQYGGSNLLYLLSVGGDGLYTLADGSLQITNGGIGLSAKSARLDIWGGTVTTPSIYMSDQYILGPGNPPQVSLSGGTVRSPSLQIWGGGFHQVGGVAVLGSISTVAGGSDYGLAGGLLLSTNIGVAIGLFSQSGGVHTNYGGILVYAGYGGSYNLSAGLLDSAAETIGAGAFVQSGASTNHAALLEVQSYGTFALQGGLLATSNSVVNSTVSGRFTQTGGTHLTGTLTLLGTCLYDLEAGLLSATNVQLIDPGELRLIGGTLTSNQSIMFYNGLLRAAGTRDFGTLFLTANGPSAISFLSNMPAVLHFRDSHSVPWYDLSHLVISNWNGNLHHLYFGSDASSLSPAQVQQVNFASPAGFPGGLYPARLLASGELVPTTSPPPVLTRLDGYIKLDWPTGFALYSSEDVRGPYELVPATFPYTNATTGSQRFFMLEPFW